MNSRETYIRGDLLPFVFTLGIVLGTVIVVPLPTLGFVLPKWAVFSLTACITMLMVLWRKPHDRALLPFVGRSAGGKCLLLFFVVMFLSPLWSLAPLPSLLGASPRYHGVLAHMVFFALGLYAVSLGRSPEGRQTLFRTILVSNAAVVLYGFLQFIGADPFATLWESEQFLGRVSSSIGQPDVLAQFILLTFPFLVLCLWRWFLTFKGRMTITGSVIAALCLMNLIVLFGTGSRAVLWGVHVLHPRFQTSTEAGRSIHSRLMIADATFDMIRMRPFGYGLEAMGLVSPQFVGKELYEFEKLTTVVDRAHSMPLDLTVTVGPLGLLSYYGFLIALLGAIFRGSFSLRRLPERREVRGELLGGFFSLLGYSTSLLFGFETIVTGVFFWVMCGWMIGLLEGEKNSLRRIPIIILTLATLASTIVSFRWMEARFMMAEARRAFAAGNIAESLQDFGEALGTFPFDRELTIEAVEVALRGFERAQDVPTERTLRSFLTQKLRILEQITGGHDGFVPLFRAWLAAVDGDVTLVEQELSRAFDMQPSSVSTYRIAAHCYELLGDEQKVLRMQQRLIELLPPAWRDPQSERGRILRKENSWLLEKPFSTGTPHRSDRR